MPNPNLLSWTSTISSLIRSGNAGLGLQQFFLMSNSGLRPNEFALSLALKACRISSKPTNVGQLIHGYSLKIGYECYAYCNTSILDFYSKTGNMTDARKFFNLIQEKCEASWNTLIDGCARMGNENEAVELFHRMLVYGSLPNSFTYTILVKLSVGLVDIGLLKFFHCGTVKAGLDGCNFVGGALVDAYGKWGELDDAVRVFWRLEDRDHVVWSTILSACLSNNYPQQGNGLLVRYVSDGYTLDPFMFATAFNLCSDSENIRLSLQLHSCLSKSAFLSDLFVRSSLMDMYVSFGMVDEAYRSFLECEEKNEMIFGSMIHGFVSSASYSSAIALVPDMRKTGMSMDPLILSFMIKAVTSLDMWEEGRALHGQIVKQVGESDLVLGNNLIGMYSRCRAIDDAAKVFVSMDFRNEFSWTAMISGFNECEKYEESLQLYQRMESAGKIEPTQFTFVAILHSTLKLEDIHKGKQIHSCIMKKGFQSHAYIESALIGMYSNCGCLDDAYQIFSAMSDKDLVSWSYMIASYSQHGHAEKALKLLSEYNDGLTTIDESIFSSCFSACSSLAALDTGQALHTSTIKTGFESNFQVEAAIINMYSKCGCIKEARNFFNRVKEQSVISYTAMICGYAQHGLGLDSLEMFDEMKVAGLEPDEVTFVGVLSACSHFGLVNEGWEFFESITSDYGMEKTMNHYACMVDLLSRAGKVREAEKLVTEAPFESKSKTVLWKTLLGACCKHGNVEDGKRIGEMLMRLEPDEVSNYVMLSNICSSASMWDYSTELKKKMEQGFTKKEPGCSWIEAAH